MTALTPSVLFFRQIDKNDIEHVGGIAANLGEMSQAGFPVPPGFCLPVSAFREFANFNGLHHMLQDIVDEDREDPIDIQNAAKRIQIEIKGGDYPKELLNEIVSAYKKLSRKLKKAEVVVRNGEVETVVKGEAVLLEEIKAAWATYFSPLALKNTSVISPTVIVQLHINSDVAGTIFSSDPVTQEPEKVVVHLDTKIGKDKFIIQKEGFNILVKETANDHSEVSEEELVELAKLASHLQEHYYFPQEADWAKLGDMLFILTSRPLRKVESQKRQPKAKVEETKFERKRKLERDTKTATMQMVNIYNPKDVEKFAKDDADGVGLLKGEHDIEEAAKLFYPRPVLYQAHDLKGDMQAIKQVHEKYDNLGVLIGNVVSAGEVQLLLRKLGSNGLSQINFKTWLSIDYPANVIEIEKYLALGAYGVSINLSKLAAHLVGKDGYSEIESSHEALDSIEWCMKHVIAQSAAKGIRSQVCFQTDAIHDELLETAVREGVTRVSVNAISFERVRHIVADTEKFMLN